MAGSWHAPNGTVKSRELRLAQEALVLKDCMMQLDKLDHDQVVRVTQFLMQRYAFAKPPQPDVLPNTGDRHT
jgi:hypothetical protein